MLKAKKIASIILKMTLINFLFVYIDRTDHLLAFNTNADGVPVWRPFPSSFLSFFDLIKGHHVAKDAIYHHARS